LSGVFISFSFKYSVIIIVIKIIGAIRTKISELNASLANQTVLLRARVQTSRPTGKNQKKELIWLFLH